MTGTCEREAQHHRLLMRIACCYADRMTQFVTRLDGSLADAVDALVEAGVVASRSDAVRQALEDLVDRHRRAQIAESIVEGYTRLPQADSGDDVSWPDAATVAMIGEEPW